MRKNSRPIRSGCFDHLVSEYADEIPEWYSDHGDKDGVEDHLRAEEFEEVLEANDAEAVDEQRQGGFIRQEDLIEAVVKGVQERINADVELTSQVGQRNGEGRACGKWCEHEVDADTQDPGREDGEAFAA